MAVLISGEGTNLQAILDGVHGRDGVEVACVAASSAGARGLERARRAGVATGVFDPFAYASRDERDRALADWLVERGIDLVVLAGFMQLLAPAFVRAFERRIINVHPSLLPAFPGLRAIEQALEYGVRLTGVTVHYVDEGVDTGPVILQEALDLSYPPDIASIEHSVHEIEHRLLPRAIRLFARGALRIDPANPRRVLIEEGRRAHH